MANYILAIDQGTTSSRAVIFDQNFRIIGASQQEFLQYYPKSGWVEHKPDDLLSSVLTTTRQALDRAGISARDILAAGITNQRETTIVWDRHTGDAIYNAIVWQDRRTADYCDQLKAENIEKWLSGKTGLLLDPYFAATKIKWLLDKIDGAMEKAKAGDLLFGTIDCWLIWKLTKRASHVTDATNASRSLMYNIHHHKWDEDLLKLFEIPESILPDVKNSADDFGIIHKDFFGSDIPLLGVAGDQQSALIGQACFQPGMLKSTYGTGCFAILNTGKKAVVSEHRLLTTIAYQLDGEVVYGLEGSIFIAGAAVQWLRDEMGLIKEASEAEKLAEKADPEQHIYLVPAFSGLGAPYWDTNVRGAIFGLTRGTGACEFAKAALESVGYQTKDLLEVMHQDWQEQANNTILRVDGGMTASDWMMQFLSDILGVDVDCPENSETTILGAAYLAGLKAGFYPNPDQFSENWTLKKRFRPQMTTQERQNKYQGWLNAVTSLINPLG